MPLNVVVLSQEPKTKKCSYSGGYVVTAKKQNKFLTQTIAVPTTFSEQLINQFTTAALSPTESLKNMQWDDDGFG